MEKHTVRVLLIEDDEDDYVLVKKLLLKAPSAKFIVDWATNYDAGLDAICREEHDVYLLDYLLEGRNGLDLLREVAGIGCKAPIIFLTGQGAYEVDLEAMRMGSADYLVKDKLSTDLLERSIRYSIERKRAENELRRYRDNLVELVEERTLQLERANKNLQLEVSERKQAQAQREELITELQEALAKVKMLSGFLPICASCKKIRDDQGYWQQIEAYIRDHSEAEFSHSICPECARKFYPDFFDEEAAG